mgnify:FL=1|tara:strand:- start:12424 stop:12897 length:474 start_codon:yes stop_codon:yes gene_type:complete
MKLYLKIKRAIRFLFYKHLTVDDQIKVMQQLNDNNLLRLFWQLSMQDRHHSVEVLERTINVTFENELLTIEELESLNSLFTLSLIHDIGKSSSHFSWLFRILSELKIINNDKSRLYRDHEINGLTELEKYSVHEDIIQYYKKELLQNKHFILDKTDY